MKESEVYKNKVENQMEKKKKNWKDVVDLPRQFSCVNNRMKDLDIFFWRPELLDKMDEDRQNGQK